MRQHALPNGEGAVGLLELLKRRARELAKRAFDFLEAAPERGLRRPGAVAGLHRGRPAEPGRWFTPKERELLAALTAVILPSDESGPGAREAGVVERLETRLAETPELRPLYARGLSDLDRLARREAPRAFTAWSPDEQRRFLRNLESIAAGPLPNSSAVSVVAGRLARLYRMWRFPAVLFFPHLVDDTLRAFYASPAAWEWLGYDGPPMPLGYLDPMRRRV